MVDCQGIVVASDASLSIADVDHNGVFCTLTLKWNRPVVCKRIMYNNVKCILAVKYMLLREALSYDPLDAGVDVFDDSDDAVGHFTTLFTSII